jgi:hypothetical protein
MVNSDTKLKSLIVLNQNSHNEWVATYPGHSVYFCGDTPEEAVAACVKYFNIKS